MITDVGLASLAPLPSLTAVDLSCCEEMTDVGLAFYLKQTIFKHIEFIENEECSNKLSARRTARNLSARWTAVCWRIHRYRESQAMRQRTRRNSYGAEVKEGQAGVEPATYRAATNCSTTELLPHVMNDPKEEGI